MIQEFRIPLMINSFVVVVFRYFFFIAEIQSTVAPVFLKLTCNSLGINFKANKQSKIVLSSHITVKKSLNIHPEGLHRKQNAYKVLVFFTLCKYFPGSLK